jgi:hypothetical protein
MALDFPNAPNPGDIWGRWRWDGGKWREPDEEKFLVRTGYPVGAMKDWPSDGIPPYWLPCDHREVSRAQYATLFARIGTTHGGGDGSTTFNLPDTRARVSIAAWTGFVGRAGGDQRTQDHWHWVSDYGHNHGLNDDAHAHGVWQTAHAHNVPDPGHAHGLPQSPHGHGVGDPGHNHGIDDWMHSHGQEHTWGSMALSLEGGEFDSASITEGNWPTEGNWSGTWNDGAGTGSWWYGEYAWIGSDANWTGCWIDAAHGWIDGYHGSGSSLSVNGSYIEHVSVGWTGDGVAGNVQPSMIVNKIIYAGP